VNLGRLVALVLLVVASLVAGAIVVRSAPGDGLLLGRIGYPGFVGLLVCGLGVLLALALLGVTSRDRGWRGRGARAAIALVAAALTVLAVELAALLAPTHHLMDNPWYLATGEGAIAASRLPFARPPHLEWTGESRGDLAILNDDADPYATTVTYQTDADGFRNSSDRRDADVAFVGDSFTEAGNVDEARTFARLVGADLGTSVRNLGRAGYTAQSELIVLEDYALPASPRLVVWQIAESNDLDEALHFQRWVDKGRPPFKDDPERRPSHVEAWRHRSPTYQLFDQLREPAEWGLQGTFRAADGHTIPIRFLDVPNAHNQPEGHAGWPLLVESYRTGVALARKQNVRVLFVLVPIKLRVFEGLVDLSDRAKRDLPADWVPPRDKTMAVHLQRLFDELGVPFVDANDALHAAAVRGEVVYLPNDTHLSPAGHAIVAQLVVDAVRRDGLLRGASQPPGTTDAAVAR
jgi:hypothetical protein